MKPCLEKNILDISLQTETILEAKYSPAVAI